jgi:hypothetical protein
VRRSLSIAILIYLLTVAPAFAIPDGTPPQTVPPTDIATGAATPKETSAEVLGYFNYGNTMPLGIARPAGSITGPRPPTQPPERDLLRDDGGDAPLTPGTTYYYRAEACNEAGTSYGPVVKTFTTLGTARACVEDDRTSYGDRRVR